MIGFQDGRLELIECLSSWVEVREGGAGGCNNAVSFWMRGASRRDREKMTKAEALRMWEAGIVTGHRKTFQRTPK